jgi:hypothetical protein
MTAQPYGGTKPASSFTLSPRQMMIATFLALIMPPILSLILVKPPFVLPSVSVISLAMAGMIALLAWAIASKRDRGHITLWDLSGLYAFLGFAAGMLSEPEYVMEFWSLPISDDGTARTSIAR